jgi:hypothetical protein
MRNNLKENLAIVYINAISFKNYYGDPVKLTTKLSLILNLIRILKYYHTTNQEIKEFLL